MAAWSEMSVGARGGVVAGVAAVIAALLYGAWSVRPVPPAPEAVAVAEPVAEPVAAPVAEPAPEPEAQAEAVEAAPVDAGGVEAGAAAEPGAAAADVAPAQGEAVAEAPVVAEPAPVAPAEPATVAPAEPATVSPPVFDLVRVEKDGSALVAGSGLPAAVMSLRIDGEEIVSVPADGAGKFVAMFNLAPSEAPRMLGMVMVLADGTEVRSSQTVAIAPTLAPVALADAGADTGTGSQGADGGTAAAPEPDAPAVEPVAPAALLVTEEGAKVLQSAAVLPEMALNVTVDSISYSPEGDVQLAGRGMAGAVVRVYLDNAQKGDGVIGEGGDWNLTLMAVDPGIYTLRVDQLDGAGKVTSRFETPFKRETLEALAAAAAPAEAAEAAAPAETGADAAVAEGESGADAAGQAAGQAAEGASDGAAMATASGPVSITVQPGFTLWAIARENLGDGVMYVQVFEANKAQIKNPDLIYPGQVFTIPKP